MIRVLARLLLRSSVATISPMLSSISSSTSPLPASELPLRSARTNSGSWGSCEQSRGRNSPRMTLNKADASRGVQFGKPALVHRRLHGDGLIAVERERLHVIAVQGPIETVETHVIGSEGLRSPGATCQSFRWHSQRL